VYLIDTNVISEARKKSSAALDKQIAATALSYGLTVVTRNQDDFKATNVDVLNPFEM
jgi:predicted nucleic acid-binding protein